MEVPSLLRLAEHKALSKISLTGSVLDLGGDTRSTYRSCFKGDPVFTTVNLDPKSRPDIVHDLEETLPFPDASFDHVLLVNVLEHIYDYRQLLSEAHRVVRPGGSVLIVVPYVFPYHPSPNDYWRFSREALERVCESVELNIEYSIALGSGVFGVRYVFLDRLMPKSIRLLSFYSVRFISMLLDAMCVWIARATSKKYKPSDYALGYVVLARKHA